MNDLTKKVLLRAAELVERGWCQCALGARKMEPEDVFVGTVRTSCGTMGVIMKAALLPKADVLCLDGALILATHEVMGIALDEVWWSGAYKDAQRALTEALLQDIWGLYAAEVSYVGWNDMKWRTQGEVAALCRLAAV
jgi:hypothetical protein